LRKNTENIVIELNSVKNLKSEDEFVKETAEKFICIVCKKYPVPDFNLNITNVKKESVKIG
jgi:hypothetical protein